jgi:hypothetical protein
LGLVLTCFCNLISDTCSLIHPSNLTENFILLTWHMINKHHEEFP